MRKSALFLLTVAAALLFVTPAYATGLGGMWGARERTSPAIVLADTVVTYAYDRNGNRVSGSGQVQPPGPSTGTVIGHGVNALGTGGTDTIFRGASGQVGVLETAANGAVTASQCLTATTSAPSVVDTVTTAPGTGQGLLGLGGHDIFLRLGTGQMVVWGINASGQVEASVPLTRRTRRRR